MSKAGRIANGILGLFLIAFAIFEAVEHGGWVVPLLVLGLIGPDLTFLIGIGAPAGRGVLPRRVVPWYNLAHRWQLPVLLLAYFTVIGDSAAWFTLGLAWLAHICVDRAAGYGLRTREGRLRPPASPPPPSTEALRAAI